MCINYSCKYFQTKSVLILLLCTGNLLSVCSHIRKHITDNTLKGLLVTMLLTLVHDGRKQTLNKLIYSCTISHFAFVVYMLISFGGLKKFMQNMFTNRVAYVFVYK